MPDALSTGDAKANAEVSNRSTSFIPFFKNCMFRLTGSLPPFTPEELLAVERVLGRSLPFPLLDFLREHNGGHPSAELYGKNGHSLYFQYVYPISRWRRPNLRDELDCNSALIAIGLIPFALEGGGKKFALADADGAIHVCEPGDEPVCLEPSLSSFLAALEAVEPPKSIDPRDERFRISAHSTTRVALEAFLGEEGSLGATNSSGYTLAQLCAINGNLDMLTLVHEAGGTLDGALHCAATLNQRRVIAYLLGVGRSVRERDRQGRRPVECIRGNPPLRKYFLAIEQQEDGPRGTNCNVRR